MIRVRLDLRSSATKRKMNAMTGLGRSGVCGMCIAACPFTQAYLRRADVVAAGDNYER